MFLRKGKVVFLIFSKYLSIKYQTDTNIKKVTEGVEDPLQTPPAPSAPAKNKAVWLIRIMHSYL